MRIGLQVLALAVLASGIFTVTAHAQMQASSLQPNTLPTAPSEWVYTAIPTVSASTTPTFTAWPSIVIPAVAGAKHVVDCVSFTVGITTNGSAYTVLALEDGVAGSAPLMQWAFLPQGTPQMVNLCGLSVVGTAGKAMTLVFTNGGGYYGYFAAGGEYASLNLTGHDAQ